MFTTFTQVHHSLLAKCYITHLMLAGTNTNDVSAEDNPGNSSVLLKGLALIIRCALAMLYLVQTTDCELGYRCAPC